MQSTIIIKIEVGMTVIESTKTRVVGMVTKCKETSLQGGAKEGVAQSWRETPQGGGPEASWEGRRLWSFSYYN